MQKTTNIPSYPQIPGIWCPQEKKKKMSYPRSCTSTVGSINRHSTTGSTAVELLFSSGKCSLTGHLYQSARFVSVVWRCLEFIWSTEAAPCPSIPALDDSGGFALLPPSFSGKHSVKTHSLYKSCLAQLLYLRQLRRLTFPKKHGIHISQKILGLE